MNLPVRKSLSEMIAEKKAKALAFQQQQQEVKEEFTDKIVAPPAETVSLAEEKKEAPKAITTPTLPAVIQKLSLKDKLAQKLAELNAVKISMSSDIPAKLVEAAKIVTAEGAATQIPSVTQIPISSKIETPLTNFPPQKEIETPLLMPNETPLTSFLTKYGVDKEAVRKEIEEEKKQETFSLSISLNEQQLVAKEMAFAGKSFCLIGAAGTGKTTAQREIAASLLQSGVLVSHTFRIQGTGERVEAPSIAFVAYTRVASGNLRRAIHKDPALEEALEFNVTTIHNLLEYQPEVYYNHDLQKESFRFIPKRTASTPLDITHLIIEEASMVGLDLWEKIYAAMRCGVQVIFIGDINQLPPVFGDSILNYALTQLPVVELTHVYRQAGDSIILENAHRILRGEMTKEAPDFKIVRGGNVNHTQAKLAATLGLTFPKWQAAGQYDPTQDIILSPWNKRELGTDNLNKWVSQYLGTERGAVVHEIVAGVTKCYLAIGDKIMYNKQVGVITAIARNGDYIGRQPLPPSVSLNRFGTYTGEVQDEDLESMDYSSLDLDAMLNKQIGEEEDERDTKKQASHHVTCMMDDGIEASLTSIGDYSPASFSLAYALTVHKAQGCEWRKVFLVLHRDHSVSLSRELFYTAVTRAREEICIIAKDEVIEKCIKVQRIKGNTVKDKIEYFNSGISLNNAVRCVK